MGDSIGKIASDVGDIIKGIFMGSFKDVVNILDRLNPFSDNFILKDVLSFLGNILSYINPFSDNFILNDVLGFLSDLVSYINPFSDNFFGKKLLDWIIDGLKNVFKWLFIPPERLF